MKTNIYIIIMAAMLLSSKLYSQQNDFVSLDGKKFMYNCQEFYPKVLNFNFGLDSDPMLGEYITPYVYYRNIPHCGETISIGSARNALKAQLQMVKDLGFNSIRLCGLEIRADSANGQMKIQYPYPYPGYSELLEPANYHHIFQILDSFFELAAEVDLKVIYLVGGPFAESNTTHIEQYRHYLDSASFHFANQPALMAYDLYNEPSYWGSIITKSTAFSATWQWYRAIRDNTPNQLVTIGLGGPTDVLMWDPGTVPVDFVSFHYYSYGDTIFRNAAPHFKWQSENMDTPWIIGETGFPADEVPHQYSNYVYRHIAQYADTIKRLNAINGSSGFSWWRYQDICFYNEGDPNIKENFFGLMNRRNETTQWPYNTQTSDPNLPPVDGLRKLDSTTFVDYNPGYTAPSSPLPGNYYNVYGYSDTTCTGKVTIGNTPVKDALIQGWLVIHPNQGKDLNWTEPVPTKTIYPIYYTFTDANGDYVLTTDCKTQFLSALFVSYIGDSLWGHWFASDGTEDVDLIALTLNYGAGIGEFNDFVVRNGDTLVWNDPMSIPGNIRVLGGGQLTIKNTVFFNTGKKVVVSPAGKLIVDGGKLTSGCEGSKWTGVEILGDPNQAQTQQYQGYIELRDSAVIENAETGLHCVLNAFTPTGEEYTSHESGGIIDADSAFFINNHIAINIEHYFPGSENVYNSYIKNCTFDYPKEIISEIYLVYIKLSGVEGVNIYANKFEGNTDNELTTRGIGIEALDATFKLNNIYAPPKPNVFNNLAYGIKCCNTSGVDNPEISLTNFNDCWRAIYLSGVVDAKVLGDTISYKSQDAENEAYGIYLDNCDGYQVEGNVLSLSDNDANKPEFGIIINNSGSEANQVYRNTFEKIEIPLNAQNVNREYYGSTGLQLLCNNIINCTVNDIIVTYEEADTCNGIKKDQGDYTSIIKVPAGNLFTYGNQNYLNYTNSSSHIVYYAHYDTASVIYYNGIPHYVKPKINIWGPISNENTYIGWDSANWVQYDCPPLNIGGGKSIETVSVLKELINMLQPRIDSASAALHIKMDNGNTQHLINRINICGSSGYQALYNDLHKYSPYVSEKVLLALVYKQGFPTNFLVNLMIKNTHVAKTYWLIDALESIQPPLTTIQLERIKEKYNEFSEMEIERMKLSGLVYKRDDAYNMIERYYAHDTLPKSKDSLIRILEQDPRVTAKYNLVNQYFALNDTVKANELIINIPKLYAFDANGKQDYEKYLLLYNVKKQLKNEGKSFNTMTESQQQLLINMIIQPSLSFSEMNSLNALRQVCEIPVGKTGNIRVKSQIPIYEEPILKPVENMEKDLENNGDNTIPENLVIEGLMDKVLAEQFNLLLYPNPTSNEVNILYNAQGVSGSIVIEILDITGRLIDTFSTDAKNNILKINTQKYNKGIYYVALIAGGKRQKVQKLVIQ